MEKIDKTFYFTSPPYINNMSKFIVDVQYVSGNNCHYFVKELAILPFGSIYPKFYFFAPPYPKQELSSRANQQNQFEVANINGLDWGEGETNYNDLPGILEYFANATIYVKGKMKENLIRKYLPTTEILQLDIPSLSKLQNYQQYCNVHSTRSSSRCAVQNCVNMYLYILINRVIE